MRYQEILEEAVRAPSGDNCQPWRFEVAEDAIRIFNVPERDTSLFNHRQLASCVAHGALLENLRIAASARGYEVAVTIFPDPSTSNLLAVARLSSREPREEPLQPFIAKRCTNRRPYDGTPLSPEARQALMASVGNDLQGSLFLTANDRDKAALADVIALNDRLVFENPDLHAFLFEHVRWTPQEAEETRDGLDLRTLELSFPDTMMFPLLKNWSLVKFLSNFGVSKIIAGNARKQALSAAAIGIITVPAGTPSDFINAGMVLERVWLEATRQGLSFQMMTGITFLMLRAVAGELGGFTPEQVKGILEARKAVAAMMGGKGEIAVVFRVGMSLPPTVYSLRQEVERLSE